MNLPNCITLSRLIFLALNIWLLFESWLGAATLNFFLAVLAAASDWLDGYVARKMNMVSNLGKLMDALIDKVLVIGLFIVLLIPGLLPLWTLPLIIATFVRDALITTMRMVAAKKGVVLGADKWGKRKTTWQLTSICVLFFYKAVTDDLPRWIPDVDWHAFGIWVYGNGLLFFLLAAILTIYSGIRYVITYVPVLKGSPSE